MANGDPSGGGGFFNFSPDQQQLMYAMALSGGFGNTQPARTPQAGYANMLSPILHALMLSRMMRPAGSGMNAVPGANQPMGAPSGAAPGGYIAGLFGGAGGGGAGGGGWNWGDPVAGMTTSPMGGGGGYGVPDTSASLLGSAGGGGYLDSASWDTPVSYGGALSGGAIPYA